MAASSQLAALPGDRHAWQNRVDAVEELAEDGALLSSRTTPGSIFNLIDAMSASGILTIASFTRNPVFIALHDAMSTWLRQREISLDVPDQDKIAYAAHERIFEAIAALYPDRAEAATLEHIVQLTASYWDALGGKPSPF